MPPRSAAASLSPRQATADPCLCRRHINTPRQAWPSLCGACGSWLHQVLFGPSERLWKVWGLILNAILPLLPSCWSFSFVLGCGVSFFWWDPTFSSPWLFSELQFWSSHRRRQAHILLLHHLVTGYIQKRS